MIPNKENDKGSIAIAMGIVSIVLLMTAISAGIFCYCFKQNCSGKINTLPPIFFCYGGWMVKNNSHMVWSTYLKILDTIIFSQNMGFFLNIQICFFLYNFNKRFSSHWDMDMINTALLKVKKNSVYMIYMLTFWLILRSCFIV